MRYPAIIQMRPIGTGLPCARLIDRIAQAGVRGFDKLERAGQEVLCTGYWVLSALGEAIRR